MKNIAFLSILLLLMGCAEGPPPGTSTTADPEGPAPQETIVRDQIEHTLNQTPEAPLAEAPVPVPVTHTEPAPKPKPVPPPPPTNPAPAPPPKTEATPAAASSAPSHQSWNQLLQRYVSDNGRVNYEGFRQDRQQLDTYLDLLAKETPDDSWSRAEALAYWINAYNAFTVQLILDNWPVSSIRDIDEPWDTPFIQLGGKSYTLNNIEHDIIRPEFSEPRIHFALVCAAVSCPPLANEAYTAQNLEKMLEDRSRDFINNERFNVTQEAVVRVSPLFDWYGEDFGDVKAFLNRYLRTDIPAQKDVHFLEYDWALND